MINEKIQFPTKENLNTLVAEMRVSAGLTQKELAERMNIKPSLLAQWERGYRNVPIEVFNEIAKECNFNITLYALQNNL